MKFTIPNEFMGVTLEDALKIVEGKSRKSTKKSVKIVKPIISHSNTPNLSQYIILEGRTHGSYSYPDIIVAKHRLGYDPSVETVAKDLGIHVQNTADEQDGTRYIGNINWETALKINQKLGNFTLTPRQFIDFQLLLKSGFQRKAKVYDGSGKVIDSSELREIYSELRQVRDPWRSEWLDAKFGKHAGSDDLYIYFGHELKTDGSLLATLDDKLLRRVNSEDWIDESSFNRQGLPTKKSKRETLYFYPPSDGSVAGFVASSGGAGLDCEGDPTGASSSLGVRAARKKI